MCHDGLLPKSFSGMSSTFNTRTKMVFRRCIRSLKRGTGLQGVDSDSPSIWFTGDSRSKIYCIETTSVFFGKGPYRERGSRFVGGSWVDPS